LTENSQNILVIAGEASGEAHAARVLLALREQAPSLVVAGIGGDNMRAAGVEILVDFSELAVMGLVEVLKQYGKLKAILNQMIMRLDTHRPDLLVLVDYPGFNLRLAKAAKKRGIPVLYYISPKVWAWRAGRVKTIAKVVDQMAVLFPFEVPIYEQAGVKVQCVGHPLIDAVDTDQTREQTLAHLALDPDKQVVGLFPGSRHSEVGPLLPIMLAAAERLQARDPNLQFVLPIAQGKVASLIEQVVAESGVAVTRVSVTSETNEFYNLTASCDAIVAASGTVTLEIALLNTPHFLVYRVAPMTYRIMRRLVRIPYVGLCNIVTGKNLIQERLQDAVTVEAVAAELDQLLAEPNAKVAAEKVGKQVRTALGPAGGAARTVEVIIEMLGHKP
jgi:lipid-A-disaccharide synthase